MGKMLLLEIFFTEWPDAGVCLAYQPHYTQKLFPAEWFGTLINDTKYSFSEDTQETKIIFYYLTIGLGSLSGILLVSLIIFGVLFRWKIINDNQIWYLSYYYED